MGKLIWGAGLVLVGAFMIIESFSEEDQLQEDAENRRRRELEESNRVLKREFDNLVAGNLRLQGELLDARKKAKA